MRALAKFGVAALMLAGSAVGTAQSANAEVGVSFGFGGPGYYGDYYGPGPYYGGYYDYYRPCSWYYDYDLPAPARCYNDYYGYYGPSVFIDGDFVFRDHDHFRHFHDRDFHHWGGRDFGWRGGHDWGRGDWHGGEHWGHNWGGGHWHH